MIDAIGFRFALIGIIKNELNKECDHESKRVNTDKDSDNEVLCGVCMCVVRDPVTLIPCLHNFCNSCYRNANEGTCPECNKSVKEAKRNLPLKELAEKYRSVFSSKIIAY